MAARPRDTPSPKQIKDAMRQVSDDDLLYEAISSDHYHAGVRCGLSPPTLRRFPARHRAMIQLVPQLRIMLACQPIDFRKGIDGLALFAKGSYKKTLSPALSSSFAIDAAPRSSCLSMTA